MIGINCKCGWDIAIRTDWIEEGEDIPPYAFIRDMRVELWKSFCTTCWEHSYVAMPLQSKYPSDENGIPIHNSKPYEKII